MDEKPLKIHEYTKENQKRTILLMPSKDGKASTMVPRVFKTNVGDIFTTNCVKATELAVGDVLTPDAEGYLAVGEGAMKWQVVKVYNLADRQKAVKIMRIA